MRPVRTTRVWLPGIWDRLEARLQLSTLTPQEQLVLELINRARANPLAEVARNPEVASLNQDLDPGTISSAPKMPLAPHPNLTNAARVHSFDMLDRNFFDHVNPDGLDPSQRAQLAGYPGGAGENIAWSGTTGVPDLDEIAIQLHEGLFESAGHRVNIMNDHASDLGLGYLSGTFVDSGISYNTGMLTQKFGAATGPYLTGVVISDQVVPNGFYDIGEGLGGYTVHALNLSTGSSFQVTTGQSGGYALPLSNGSYAISLTSPGSGLTQSLGSVQIQGQNVKLDAIPSASTKAWIENRTLIVEGTQGDDIIALLRGPASTVQIDLGGDGSSDFVFARDVFDYLEVRLLGGHDQAILDESQGTFADLDVLVLRGGPGRDTLIGGAGNQILQGDDGHDVLIGGSGSDQLEGGKGDDTLGGGPGADTLDGQGGHDLLNGGSENDLIWGQLGNDTLNGGLGDDALDAGGDRDLLDGGDGHDTLNGQQQADTIFGGAGADWMIGKGGADWLQGNGGADLIQGGFDPDSIQGGGGRDTIYGGEADDTLQGGADPDWIRGGPGGDLIQGGRGADTLIGDKGINDLIGGPGSDTYQIQGGDGGHHHQLLQHLSRPQMVRHRRIRLDDRFLAAQDNLEADHQDRILLLALNGSDLVTVAGDVLLGGTLSGGLGIDTLSLDPVVSANWTIDGFEA